MKYFFILLTLFGFVLYGHSQTAEDSVRATINKLFTAMKEADPAGLKTVFADSAIMQTIGRSKDGNIEVRNESVQGFIDFIKSGKPGTADERISFGLIKIEGPLAIAWTPYRFYYNGQFSHCGVNSFQLVRLKGEWKVQYAIDTRRRQDCPPE